MLIDLPNTARLLYQPGRIRILANERATEADRRFAIAHECGHIMFYRAAELVFERDESIRKNIARWGDSVAQERLCNWVAAELLMPKDWITAQKWTPGSGGLDFASRVSETYGVSLAAALKRLVYVGFPCVVMQWEYRTRPGSVEKLRLTTVWERGRHSRFFPCHRPAPEASVIHRVYETRTPESDVEYGYYFGHDRERYIEAMPMENGVIALVHLSPLTDRR